MRKARCFMLDISDKYANIDETIATSAPVIALGIVDVKIMYDIGHLSFCIIKLKRYSNAETKNKM